MDFTIGVVISDYMKYGQSFLDNEAFKYLPDLRKLGIQDITEDEFYKLLGLTRQEINQIKIPSSNEEEDEEPNVLVLPSPIPKKKERMYMCMSCHSDEEN